MTLTPIDSPHKTKRHQQCRKHCSRTISQLFWSHNLKQTGNIIITSSV